jgi:hypothetical protein
MQASGQAPEPSIGPRKSLNAPVSGLLHPAIEKLLSRLTWVHSLNGLPSCEGCANDGEAGYCLGAALGPQQDEPDELYCHCGHRVAVLEEHADRGWICAGEFSEHWPKADRLDAECGHCGWKPADEDIAEWYLEGRVTAEEIGADLGVDEAALIVSTALR